MRFALVPKQRDWFHTLVYYLFRFLGPSMLSIGVVMIGLSHWGLILFNLEFTLGSTTVNLLFAMDVVFLAMYLYSLFMAISGDNGKLINVLKKRMNNKYVNENILRSLPQCNRCGLPKPPRCHHCSYCNACHLRMDHHCPALGICVALRNMQPFLVMLFWGQVLTFTTTAQCALAMYVDASLRVPALCLGGLIGVLFIMLSALKFDVMYRVKKNTTVVENLKNAAYRPYDLGKEENLRQVFGTGFWNKIIPRKSTMTGFEWLDPEFRNDSYVPDNVDTLHHDVQFQNVPENTA